MCRYHSEGGDRPLIVERDEDRITVRLPHGVSLLSLCAPHASGMLSGLGMQDSVIEAMSRKGGKG
jgi:hypothetical protein